MENRQLRQWVFLLYADDNLKHERALAILKMQFHDYFYIRHIPFINNDTGEIEKKAHYHCRIRFDSPTWLSSVLKYLELDEEDAHLFHSLDDFKSSKGKKKFKSIEDYILYCTHTTLNEKVDKYWVPDFDTNTPDLIYKALYQRDLTNSESFVSLLDFIDKEYRKDINTRFYSMRQWYLLAFSKGYGDIFYKNWSKIKDILQDYIINI